MLYESVPVIDVEGVVKYVSSLQQPDGSFIGDSWGGSPGHNRWHAPIMVVDCASEVMELLRAGVAFVKGCCSEFSSDGHSLNCSIGHFVSIATTVVFLV